MPLHITLMVLLGTLPGSALVIRDYQQSRHDRFISFPASPSPNPGFLYNEALFTGLAWHKGTDSFDDKRQFALVSRQHCIFASHAFNMNVGLDLCFVKAGGEIVTRQISSIGYINDEVTETPTDLILVRFDPPIGHETGIQPFPYLNLPNESDYLGEDLLVFGWYAKAGVSSISAFDDLKGAVTCTRVMKFRYFNSFGTANDAKLENKDSGSPSFATVDGSPAIVGVHFAIDSFPFYQDNYDSFIPHYVTELDTLMAPLGYRMRPVNAAATSLSGTSSTIEATPRRAKPLTLQFELENTGAKLTGNLEVEFVFPAAQQPDAITAPGWVTSRSGSRWTLRKATLATASAERLAASWSSAPLLPSIDPAITWRSDTVADRSSSPVISLAPSYAAWAIGLTEGAETDNPDHDPLINLLEYALGGDPESGLQLLSNGHPLAPTLTADATTITFCYPERSDKALRGLDYEPEFTSDLASPAWTTTPPAGLSSGTAAYDPDLPGFVKRSLSWPIGASPLFARLRVTLSE